MRVSTAFATVLLATMPVAATADASRGMAFSLLEDGSIVVPVTIGGRGPYQFAVDTGSSRTVVSSELATRLRLSITATSPLITPAGRARQPLAALDGIDLGQARGLGVQALIAPSTLSASNKRVDGLIGQDVLGPLVYTIDYMRRRLIWHDVPPDEGRHERLALQITDGRVLVSLPQAEADLPPLQLIPDSGADGVVLFRRPSRRLPLMTPLDVALLSTLAGPQIGRRVLLDELRVGGVVLRNQTAVIIPQSDASMGDGLLPLHVFARVTFNGPAQYLTVEAR